MHRTAPAGRRLILLPLLLAALCACRGPRNPPFIIGMYGANDPAALAKLKREGFNAAQTNAQDPVGLAAMATAAKKTGMTLLAWPQGLMKSNVSANGFPMAVWYLADEPDVAKLPLSELQALEGRVKRWSPKLPTAFVLGDGRRAPAYAAAGDIMMVDWYPVPHLPLESAGEHVSMTVGAAGRKPVWAVLQAMDWKDYPQRNSKKPRIGRFPDAHEIRFMTYHSILSWAKGIWYFTYTKPDQTTLPDTPEEWIAVTGVVHELAALRPIFEDGKPAYLPFPPEPDGALARAWRYHWRDYVIIANPWPKTMVRVPPELLKMDWRPLFEMRRYQKELLQKSGEDYYLPPYRVMVFESRWRWRKIAP
ncbi:MAG: hypothetical protein NTY77_15335 [Elusimicrobia bacterium]|nr:hypothetical protein [Elusimicrobiota bacterium]